MLERSRERHLGGRGVLALLLVPVVVELVALDRLSIPFLKNRSVIDAAVILAVRDRHAGHIERNFRTQAPPNHTEASVDAVLSRVHSTYRP